MSTILQAIRKINEHFRRTELQFDHCSIKIDALFVPCIQLHSMNSMSNEQNQKLLMLYKQLRCHDLRDYKLVDYTGYK